MYAVYFHSIVITDYRANNPKDKEMKYMAIFPNKENALSLAVEMNNCGAGGYTVHEIDFKIVKPKRIKK